MTATPTFAVEQLLLEEPFLRSLARTLLAEEADEVVQQTWLQALGHRGAPVLEPRLWLARIARNVAHNLRRSGARRVLHEREAARQDCVPSSTDLLEREERRRSLVFAVDRLPPTLRTVVLLRYFDNLQPREIAKELGLSVTAVSNRLLRGLALLRQRLDAEHGGDRRAWLVPLVPFAAGRPGGVSALGVTTAGVLLMTMQTKMLSAVAVLLLAGLAFWGCADLWSTVPFVGAGSLPPTTSLRADLPHQSKLVQAADVVQRTEVESAMTVQNKTVLLVHATYGDDHAPIPDLVLTVGRLGEEGRVGPCRLRTDAQGNARFENLVTGPIRIWSNRDHSQDAEVRAGEVIEVDYVLPPEIDVAGIVVDRDGLPVPGAEVHLGTPAYPGMDAAHAATADADGRFALRCCFNPSLVGARAAGHAPSSLQLLYGKKGAKFDVRVELPGPGGDVEGIVVGPDNSPVADAMVRIGTGNLDSLQPTNPGDPPLPAQVRTDLEGHFRAVGLIEGEHPVVVRAVGLAPWTGTCRVTTREVSLLSVALGEGVSLAGVVRSSEGTPVPQANVSVGEEGELTYYRTRSGADGAFHLDGLPPAEFALDVKHQEFGKAAMKLRGTAGETLKCDIRLSLGLVLRGRLLTDSGEVVPRATVYASAAPGDGEARWDAGVRVDAEGRFVIDNCPDGRAISVRAEGEGIEALRGVFVDPRAGELLLRAQKAAPLPPASARVLGTFVLADGKPAANIMLSVNRSLTATDENGHFEAGPLVPGTARVSINLDELPQFRSQRELAADAVWDLGTVRLAGGTILARLEGNAEGAHLGLYDQQRVWITNLDTGTSPFRSKIVSPGLYRLLVSGPEIAAMALPVEVRENVETIVDVRPQRGVARRIEFHWPGGSQNDMLRLDVTIANGADLVLKAFVTNLHAPPVLACRLAPGNYTVTAAMMSMFPHAGSQGEGVSGRAEITVVEGAETTVRVTVR
jgi:RNA polymerase sigma factor (sigma-70 family)